LESLNQILSVIEIDMGFLNSVKSFFTRKNTGKYQIPENPGQLAQPTSEQEKGFYNTAYKMENPPEPNENKYKSVFQKTYNQIGNMIGSKNVMKNIRTNEEIAQNQKRQSNLQLNRSPNRRQSFEPVSITGGARHKKRKHRKTIKKHKKQHKKQHK